MSHNPTTYGQTKFSLELSLNSQSGGVLGNNAEISALEKLVLPPIPEPGIKNNGLTFDVTSVMSLRGIATRRDYLEELKVQPALAGIGNAEEVSARDVGLRDHGTDFALGQLGLGSAPGLVRTFLQKHVLGRSGSVEKRGAITCGRENLGSIRVQSAVISNPSRLFLNGPSIPQLKQQKPQSITEILWTRIALRFTPTQIREIWRNANLEVTREKYGSVRPIIRIFTSLENLRNIAHHRSTPKINAYAVLKDPSHSANTPPLKFPKVLLRRIPIESLTPANVDEIREA